MLKNEVIYYIVIPLIIPILNWIKSEYDIKSQNKELGYWEKKYKKLDTFIDIVMRLYKRMFINLFIMYLSKLFVSIWYDSKNIFYGIAFVYMLLNTVLVIITFKETTTKIELLKNKKVKKCLLISIYMIFQIIFWEVLIEKCKVIFQIIVGIILIIWSVFLAKYSDRAYILENSFADIYIRGNEKAEFAAAGTIRKQGDWIIVNRYINGFDEEIRINEKDIVRIDYYGEPILFIK